MANSRNKFSKLKSLKMIARVIALVIVVVAWTIN